MLNKTRRLAIMAICLGIVALMAGCAATYTGIRYSELKVENKMSASIFLDPVPPAQRTVFIQVRNTTDKQFDMQADVVAAVQAKGFRVVDDPNQAHYWLQANILSVGLNDQSALEKSELAGFGGPIAGAAAGAVIAGSSHAGAGAAIGAVAGGAAELITGAMVKVNTYAVITDLQISERSGAAISQNFNSNLQQGTGQTMVSQQSSSTAGMKKYQTRIISTARQTNLEWPEAYPALRQGIAQSIAGII